MNSSPSPPPRLKSSLAIKSQTSVLATSITRIANSNIINKRHCGFASCYRTRNMITLMLFLGMASVYSLRTNISVLLLSGAEGLVLTSVFIAEKSNDIDDRCYVTNDSDTAISKGAPFSWTSKERGIILDATIIGYIISQIPSGFLAQRLGFKLLLGIGMVINTICGFLIPLFAYYGINFLMFLRFFQGLGEAAFIPCSHGILSNWSPPNERSRRVAIVYTGAQFGSSITILMSKIIANNEILGGWSSVFYFLSGLGIIWLIGFFFLVVDDPIYHPRIDEEEKNFIVTKIWGVRKPQHSSFPWREVVISKPFWAIAAAHIGNFYGLSIFMVEIPIFMKKVWNYDVNKKEYLAAMPLCIMWIFALMCAFIIDELITHGKISITKGRKICNGIGHFGPALSLTIVCFTYCNHFITVLVLIVGVGLNGCVYSGFYANHIDLSPCFACILIAFTNTFANIIGCIASVIADLTIHQYQTILSWQILFSSAAFIYIICNIIYLILASGKTQTWGRPGLRRSSLYIIEDRSLRNN